ncbi:3-oxoacyl-ACP synthase III family protein [Natranaerobius thermophilus]|uniref:Beta-ketoacyl-acyl-carrier-protein synthase I n=1 Tax=Natranaerobius thermophilus (strain ATCC BAA-1301 / DSM 18059 / JW/NM-WN-LF) TaxID=457570 RepID=B2A2R5_NATTJ|nr:ketoacyl-ACP synthase III [Natranaerobius thermophilus]ACB86283.1 Beta-ketoacyl-acyl-carrier-protein synthase I [Natranaerobius thermophilus JW/NM-WN-LF]
MNSLVQNAVITGTGKYLPPHLYTNNDIAEILGHPLKDGLETKLGIKQRYFTGKDESTADMAVKAGEQAIANAGLSKDDIQLLIIATDTPEYITPATSSVVQGRLETFNAGTFDLNASCAGFVSGLEVASRMIQTGAYRHILLIGVYNMSKFVDKSDSSALPIFADGAGAVVLSGTKNQDRGFMNGKMIADGTQYDFLGIYGGGAKNPMNEERLQKGEHQLTFLKPLPPDRNIKIWPPLIEEVLQSQGLNYQDIDHIFFTQINKMVIQEVMKIIDLPEEKTTYIMGEYGYTGSSCIPIALNKALSEDKLSPGDLVLFVGSGVGFAVACAAFRW